MTYALACIAFSSSPIVTFVTSLAAVLFLPVLSRKWISRIRSPVPLLQYDKWYRKTYLYEYLTTLSSLFSEHKTKSLKLLYVFVMQRTFMVTPNVKLYFSSLFLLLHISKSLFLFHIQCVYRYTRTQNATAKTQCSRFCLYYSIGDSQKSNTERTVQGEKNTRKRLQKKRKMSK